MEEKVFLQFGKQKKGLRNFIVIYSIIAIIIGLFLGCVLYSSYANKYGNGVDCENCSVGEWGTLEKCWIHKNYESKEDYIMENSNCVMAFVISVLSIIPVALFAWLFSKWISASKKKFKTWTLDGDSIIAGRCIIPLSAVNKVELCASKSKSGDGTILLYLGNKMKILVYPHKRSADGARVAAYIEKRVADNLELEKKEYRMRCNVCGKVFCYKLADLRRNLEYSKRAKSSANMAMLNAIGGTQLGMYAEFNEADRYIDKIVDYSKCPECHSTDLTQLTDEEWGQQTVNQPAATASAADELKKYKELLDGGIITQEEFDAKKKQLLGL